MTSLEHRVQTLEGGPRRACSLCGIERELAALDGKPPPPPGRPCLHNGKTFADVLRETNELLKQEEQARRAALREGERDVNADQP